MAHGFLNDYRMSGLCAGELPFIIDLVEGMIITSAKKNTISRIVFPIDNKVSLIIGYHIYCAEMEKILTILIH